MQSLRCEDSLYGHESDTGITSRDTSWIAILGTAIVGCRNAWSAHLMMRVIAWVVVRGKIISIFDEDWDALSRHTLYRNRPN